ncbi:MAG: hypothetical protein J0H07_04400 [Sphingobacteriales bacterium]|nr:hypothetical protein [Sphingobacteriales bacterium]
MGIVLAVITFWLFAQTTLNIAPAMSADLKIALPEHYWFLSLWYKRKRAFLLCSLV